MSTDTWKKELLEEVKQIRLNQQQAFGVGTAFAAAIAAALTFVIALALNNALQLTFGLIPVGKDSVLGAWIYAVIALILGLAGLYLIYRFLQPALHKKLDKM